MILAITKPKNNQAPEFKLDLIFNNDDSFWNRLLLGLEISQVCCSVIVWFFFIAKQAPLVFKKADDRIAEIDSSSNNAHDDKMIFKGKPPIKKSKKILLIMRNFIIYITYLFFDPLFLYYLCYLTCAILGMFDPIFVALLLLDVFVRFLI